jgi:hypothetical protein
LLLTAALFPAPEAELRALIKSQLRIAPMGAAAAKRKSQKRILREVMPGCRRREAVSPSAAGPLWIRIAMKMGRDVEGREAEVPRAMPSQRECRRRPTVRVLAEDDGEANVSLVSEGRGMDSGSISVSGSPSNSGPVCSGRVSRGTESDAGRDRIVDWVDIDGQLSTMYMQTKPNISDSPITAAMLPPSPDSSFPLLFSELPETWPCSQVYNAPTPSGMMTIKAVPTKSPEPKLVRMRNLRADSVKERGRRPARKEETNMRKLRTRTVVREEVGSSCDLVISDSYNGLEAVLDDYVFPRIGNWGREVSIGYRIFTTLGVIAGLLRNG